MGADTAAIHNRNSSDSMFWVNVLGCLSSYSLDYFIRRCCVKCQSVAGFVYPNSNSNTHITSQRDIYSRNVLSLHLPSLPELFLFDC